MIPYRKRQDHPSVRQFGFVDNAGKSSFDGCHKRRNQYRHESWSIPRAMFDYDVDDDEDDEDEFRLLPERKSNESDNPSPPLWKNTASCESKSADSSPMHINSEQQHHYVSREVHSVARAQEIVRYQQKIMDMAKDMRDSAYELSLRYMVKSPSSRINYAAQERPVNVKDQSIMENLKKKSTKQMRRMPKNDSMDTAGFLIKMFTPMSIAGKRRKKISESSTSAAKISPKSNFFEKYTSAKVSPKPSYSEADHKGKFWTTDSEWWRRSEIFGRLGKSSCESSNSRRSRNIIGCYTFLHRSKSSEM